MTKNGNVLCFRGTCQLFCQPIYVVCCLGLRNKRRPRKQLLIVKWLQQHPTVRERAKTFKTHGVQPLKNVAIFTMLGCATVLLNEALYLFKTCDNALITGRTPVDFLGGRKLGQLVRKLVQIRDAHIDLPP